MYGRLSHFYLRGMVVDALTQNKMMNLIFLLVGGRGCVRKNSWVEALTENSMMNEIFLVGCSSNF